MPAVQQHQTRNPIAATLYFANTTQTECDVVTTLEVYPITEVIDTTTCTTITTSNQNRRNRTWPHIRHNNAELNPGIQTLRHGTMYFSTIV